MTETKSNFFLKYGRVGWYYMLKYHIEQYGTANRDKLITILNELKEIMNEGENYEN